MEIYAPGYYSEFKCIADKCRHSCCIDWEIDIDNASYEKYRSLKNGYGGKIFESIEECESGAYFKLTKKNRCPHLDANGLCRIIIEVGEDYLCDICKNHPRFFNEVCGRVECGLGLCCEEAVRLTLEDNMPFELVRIGEDERESSFTDSFAISERDRIIEFIEREKGSFRDKLDALEKSYSVKVGIHTLKEWINIFLSLEILDDEWYNMLEKTKFCEFYESKDEFEPYFERFFKYLVYRHVTKATSENHLRASLGFAILGAKLVMYLASCKTNLTRLELFDIIRMYSSEIEYSEDNSAELIFEFESELT